LAFNVTAPLLFEDPAAASASLRALETKPRILAATLTKDGRVFATYVRGNARPLAAAPTAPELTYHFEQDRLLLSIPIRSDGATFGTLTLVSSLEERDQRMRRYLLLTAG